MKKLIISLMAVILVVAGVFCFASCGETAQTTTETVDVEAIIAQVKEELAKETVDPLTEKEVRDIIADTVVIPEAETVDVDAIVAEVIAKIEGETAVVNGYAIKGDYMTTEINTTVKFAVRYFNIAENEEFDETAEESETNPRYIRDGEPFVVEFEVPYTYTDLYVQGNKVDSPAHPRRTVTVDIEGEYKTVDGILYNRVADKVGTEVDVTVFPATAPEKVAKYEYCTFDFDSATIVDAQ